VNIGKKKCSKFKRVHTRMKKLIAKKVELTKFKPSYIVREVLVNLLKKIRDQYLVKK